MGTSLLVDKNGYYTAENYDHLADSPIFMGDLTSASTTVDEMESARDNVAHTLENVISAGGNLREARLRAAENAWKDTQEAINDISGDATLGEAAATIRGQAVILATEIDRITSVTCDRR